MTTSPEAALRITRFPSLTTQQFHGCAAAFIDSLTGELNAATLALRRLEGQAKGSAFAYEMTLDTHRYGALIVLDRWARVAAAFGAHLDHPAAAGVRARVDSAENLLGHANRLIDAAEEYGSDVVEACALAFQSAGAVFGEERKIAEDNAKLGPMMPEDYRNARHIFLEDLAAR